MRIRLVALGAVAGAFALCSAALARTVVGDQATNRITDLIDGSTGNDRVTGGFGHDTIAGGDMAGDCERVRRG